MIAEQEQVLIAVIMAMIRLKQHPSMQSMSLGATEHFRLDKPLSIKHLLRRNNKLFKYVAANRLLWRYLRARATYPCTLRLSNDSKKSTIVPLLRN